jgi:hypothetical protein
MQLKHPSSPSTKKFKVSARKVMFTVFYDSQGVILAYFQKLGENVNPASHCEVLLKLRDSIRRNCSDLLQEEYCFIMTMPDPIQPEQPRREFENYS